MVKCPNCSSEMKVPNKQWKYNLFDVKSFECPKCNTKFRDYTKDGEHVFFLVFKDGKYRKG